MLMWDSFNLARDSLYDVIDFLLMWKHFHSILTFFEVSEKHIISFYDLGNMSIYTIEKYTYLLP